MSTSKPRIARRLCESGILPQPTLHGDCPNVSTVDAALDGVPVSLCPECHAAFAHLLDAPWAVLSLTRPAAHLRELARGTDAEGKPLLSLSEAATLLGYAHASAAHRAERREAGRTHGEGVDGGMTVQSLLDRAYAYGQEVEVRVRRRGR